MVRVIFVDPEGGRHEVEAEEGMTLMEAAVKNMVPGIEADCGGACACATCHVYVDPAWVERIPGITARSEAEEDMLDFAFDVRENSRLSCQIRITPEMDGIVLHVPEQQG
ncbi:MAG TPA: 2Fe-2S iron-sulfur cluster binding domain-containing protein [Thermopetrobacter sp.]|nr:2Fe-2S iron-sulfur cluster binding domain-containing protein [Thermopetrobacter sp.]